MLSTELAEDRARQYRAQRRFEQGQSQRTYESCYRIAPPYVVLPCGYVYLPKEEKSPC